MSDAQVLDPGVVTAVATDTTTATTAAVDTAKQTTDATKAVETAAKADTKAADASATTTTAEGDTTAGKWDGWREEASGGNEDIQKLLNRYGSLKGIGKALFEKDQMIRSGKKAPEAPDPADEKAVAAYRKEQGIPDDAAGYKAPTVKGHEWTDADKPLLATFFEKSHARGVPQGVVETALSVYAEMQQDLQARQAEADKASESAFEDKMRQSWGRDYRGNWALAQRFLGGTPLGTAWANAVMPDGRMLGHIPEFADWAAEQGRQRFGDAAFIPGDANSKGASRLEEIGKYRREKPDEYNRDKKVQAEELDLIDRELKSKKASSR